MLLGLFANIFVQFRGCVLYTRATFTQAYTAVVYSQTQFIQADLQIIAIFLRLTS